MKGELCAKCYVLCSWFCRSPDLYQPSLRRIPIRVVAQKAAPTLSSKNGRLNRRPSFLASLQSPASVLKVVLRSSFLREPFRLFFRVLLLPDSSSSPQTYSPKLNEPLRYFLDE